MFRADVLADLDEALNADGISLVLAELKDPERNRGTAPLQFIR